MDALVRVFSSWKRTDEGVHPTIFNRPLDVVRVGDEEAPPCQTPDPDLIRWATAHDRLLISRDKSTLPRHLQNHLATDETSPGIVLLPEGMRIPDTVELLFLIAFITEATEWANACRWTQ